VTLFWAFSLILITDPKAILDLDLLQCTADELLRGSPDRDRWLYEGVIIVLGG